MICLGTSASCARGEAKDREAMGGTGNAAHVLTEKYGSSPTMADSRRAGRFFRAD